MSHVDEIASLLNRTWPALYGATGCPHFTSDYLAWLYGGPDGSEHFILGCRIDGELVGIKTYLFRPMRWAGRDIRTHLVTHLTIAPGLPLGVRVSLANEFLKLHTILDDEEGAPAVRGSAVLAFFEADKSLSRSMEHLTKGAGIGTTQTTFRHAIVNPRKLRSLVADPASVSVRPCSGKDMPEVLKLLRAVAPDGLALQPSAGSLWHHVTQAPQGRAFVAEDGQGRILGFLACYVLESIKQETRTRVAVVEFLAAENREALARLLHAAVDHAEAAGTKGVVVENTTTIPLDDLREVGVMLTPREMIFAIRSRTEKIDTGASFLCDIK